MMHGDPVITHTDIKARTESMGIATLTSEGFLETRHSTAFLVAVHLMQDWL